MYMYMYVCQTVVVVAVVVAHCFILRPHSKVGKCWIA